MAAAKKKTELKIVKNKDKPAADAVPKLAEAIIGKKPVALADAKMAEQLKAQLAKTKPSDSSLASQAMEHADKALAYADFTRRIRHKEAIDGGLLNAALQWALTEAGKDAARKVEPVPPDALMGFMEQVSEGTHPYGLLYVATSKAMREVQERVQGTPRTARLTALLGLILGAKSKAVAEELAQRALASAELHFYSEWGKTKLTAVDAKRDFKTMSALADFFNSQGLVVKAKQTADAAQSVVPPKPEPTVFDKLSKSETSLVNAVKSNGGSIITDAIKKGFETGEWSVKDMSRLMDQKILSTPREGVVRLDESKLVAPADPPPVKGFGAGKQGPPRKSNAVKTPKPEQPHKWQKLIREGSGQEAWTCLDCAQSVEKMDDTLKLGCKGVPKPPRASGANKPIVNPGAKCLCGCGLDVKPTSRFGIGHDAKLHSAVLKAAKGDKAILAALPLKNETSAAYLKQAPWMTPEVLKAIGL